ncbi:hypothetical protein [Dongia sedimenti]|uniref:Fenitrothion hydrolase n=1 Tax=Dongia sedimenti TaxID=3064282 RepID=A0ABU0YIP9_9PROT|nr:hypothetical protein [Rhodospirillaceae bacterium R-7]
MRGGALLILCAGTTPAWAHAGAAGFVLLLPTELYILGGALAVLVSVVVLAAFYRGAATPAPAPAERELPRPLVVAISLSVLLFLALLVAAGFWGSPDPIANPLPTTLWTVWWAGFTLAVALLGDLWAFANPWIGLALLGPKRPLLAYPDRVGSWPAVLQFLGFAWFELVYPTPQDPARLAFAVVAYWLGNFVAMMVFGPRWLERGEAFSVFFAMVGRLGTRSWRLSTEPRLAVVTSLGPPARRLREAFGDLSGAAFVLVTLSAVSFDGLSRTFFWVGRLGLNPLEFPGRSVVIWPNTVGLLLSAVTLAALYAAAITLGLRLSGAAQPLRRTLCRFVLSIVPISIAYHLAHYLQSLIVDFPTAVLALSDPFGLGWSLLPDEGLQHGTTMGLGPEGIMTAYRAQTAIIVAGHVLATLAAHRIALFETGNRRQAVLMGIPLAVLMVFYTVFGLWLLSTPEIG